MYIFVNIEKYIKIYFNDKKHAFTKKYTKMCSYGFKISNYVTLNKMLSFIFYLKVNLQLHRTTRKVVRIQFWICPKLSFFILGISEQTIRHFVKCLNIVALYMKITNLNWLSDVIPAKLLMSTETSFFNNVFHRLLVNESMLDELSFILFIS